MLAYETRQKVGNVPLHVLQRVPPSRLENPLSRTPGRIRFQRAEAAGKGLSHFETNHHEKRFDHVAHGDGALTRTRRENPGVSSKACLTARKNSLIRRKPRSRMRRSSDE